MQDALFHRGVEQRADERPGGGPDAPQPQPWPASAERLHRAADDCGERRHDRQDLPQGFDAEHHRNRRQEDGGEDRNHHVRPAENGADRRRGAGRDNRPDSSREDAGAETEKAEADQRMNCTRSQRLP